MVQVKAATAATGLDHAHNESEIDRATAALKAVAAGNSREAVALAVSLPGLATGASVQCAHETFVV